MIACLLLEPFALWHAERAHVGVPVVVVEAGRVRHANRQAVKSGVKHHLPLHAALSRVPDLACEEYAAPVLHAAWDTLVETLFAYSPRIEPVSLGRVYLTLREDSARELAALFRARVGLAESRETALLAALSAKSGEVKVVPDIDLTAFLRTLPVPALLDAGLSPENAQRLRVLGVTEVGELLKWSKAQQSAFLGDDAKTLKPYLFGPRSVQIASYRPAPSLEAGFDFEDVVCEPCQIEPVIALLSGDLIEQLGGKQARQLVCRARTPLGWLEGAREIKTPIKDAKVLSRLALLTLHDSGAAPLGIERLELSLSGLVLPSRQGGLWPSVRELDAVETVLRRFPSALVRVQWRNPLAYASDAQYTWVDWQSGETRSRPVPGRARPLTVPVQAASPGRPA